MNRITRHVTKVSKNQQDDDDSIQNQDWETDPDFIHDMDEFDQRWGGKSKRTVGSINMNELIDEVRKDHKLMREKFDHPSQKDHSGGFGGKFGIQHDRQDPSALDYNYHEELSKHTSQEIKRSEIITSSSSSQIIKSTSSSINDAKKTFLEKSGPDSPTSTTTSTSYARTKPEFLNSKPVKTSLFSNPSKTSFSDYHAERSSPKPPTAPKGLFEESSIVKRIIEEKKTSQQQSSSSSDTFRGSKPTDMPPAMKSIQEKIEAFKKEFKDIEDKVAKKSDLSEVIKKSSSVSEKKSQVEYVSRNNDSPTNSNYQMRSPTNIKDFPKTSIKSLSQKFETMGRDDDEFKRKSEQKRMEFFNEIKNQVRETRKELDGFDPIDESDSDHNERILKNSYVPKQTSPSSKFPSKPSSRISNEGSQHSSIYSKNKPKVYTKRETTEEKIVSRIVKENDKVIENETKKDFNRSSSCHGSSEDEEDPRSIRVIEQTLRHSPTVNVRTESPVDRVKREVPIIEPEIKGAGLMARTLYDYEAGEPDELSFDVDDLITNIEKIDVGWYKGMITYKNGQKRVGLFPANYVKLLNDDNGEY